MTALALLVLPVLSVPALCIAALALLVAALRRTPSPLAADVGETGERDDDH